MDNLSEEKENNSSNFNITAYGLFVETKDIMLDHLIAVIFLLIFLLTFVINTLLLVAILKTKVLQRCTNAFIFSLAVSELINGIFKMPFVAYLRFFHISNDMDGPCQISHFFSTTGRVSATLILMVISIDRYVAVSKPLKYSSIITQTSTGCCIAGAWICAIVLSILPILNTGEYAYNRMHKLCEFNFRKDKVFIKFYVIISMIIPIVVITICLFLIMKEAKTRHRILDIAMLTITVTTASSRITNFRKSILTAMRAWIFIVIAYLTFCLPQSVSYLIRLDEGYQLSFELMILLDILPCLFCVVTPVMITFFNKKFQHRFLEMYCCTCLYRKISPNTGSRMFPVTSGIPGVLDASLVTNKINVHQL